MGQSFANSELQDHAYYGIGYRVNVTTDQELANPTYLQQATTDFIQHQAGPLTNIGADIIGTWRLHVAL